MTKLKNSTRKKQLNTKAKKKFAQRSQKLEIPVEKPNRVKEAIERSSEIPTEKIPSSSDTERDYILQYIN
mgnify:CR=1 FL=1